MIRRFPLEQLVRGRGGRSLIILLAAIQLIALLGAIPGILSVRANAEFDEGQLRIFSILVPFLLLLTYLILLGVGWWLTPMARKRLDRLANESTKPESEEEFLAW